MVRVRAPLKPLRWVPPTVVLILLAKEKMLSEDEKKRGEEEIQKITDRFIEEINAIGERKEKEILEV